MESHRVLYHCLQTPILVSGILPLEVRRIVGFESCARVKCKYDIILPDPVEDAFLPFVCLVNLCKQVYDVVGLSELVLDVIVLCRNAESDELLLECSTLFEHAVCFIYRHLLILTFCPKCARDSHSLLM